MAKANPESQPSENYLDPDLVDALQKRLSRVEGHVRGINRMLGEQCDCDDLLTQVAGVKAAINQISIKLLEGHLDSCVAEALRSGDGDVPVTRFKNSLALALKR